MIEIPYYIVDVFAKNKYEGNQLAVFVDVENQISEDQMLQITKEINFAESIFIKAIKGPQNCSVSIFTPEYEVPFAGHPCLGVSYIIAKYLLPAPTSTLTLHLKIGEIAILIKQPTALDTSLFYMRQVQPIFRKRFTPKQISESFNIDPFDLDLSLPIQEITTGLPYIIIPLKNKEGIEKLDFSPNFFNDFLLNNHCHKSNSIDQLSTSLFFFTKDTYEADNDYNTRMFVLENGEVVEDAATGSANGCFLAYLLTYQNNSITAKVEQGFQMNRKSYLYLEGSRQEEQYELNVGGYTKLIARGIWYL